MNCRFDISIRRIVMKSFVVERVIKVLIYTNIIKYLKVV